MTRLISQFVTGFVFVVAGASAQNLGITVRIDTVPDGLPFNVDSQYYSSAASLVWPVGSVHVLSASPQLLNNELNNQTQYAFVAWEWSGQVIPGGSVVTVTAGQPMTDIQAIYTLAYALNLNFFFCPADAPCNSAGTIYVNQQPYTSNQTIYMSAGGSVQLLAVPNPGYVFTGWGGKPGSNQMIHGPLDTITMTGPLTVYPQFIQARPVNLATSPVGLSLYADGAMVPTPTSMPWGWNTAHTVGAVSPQQDTTGAWWAFASWSDGGASTHPYTVAPTLVADNLTATFSPATVTPVRSAPLGLALIVDGRNNWPNYNFIWGAGETHTLEAPLQDTDAQGNLWGFVSWANGGPRIQTYTVPPPGTVTTAPLTATYTRLAQLTINSPLGALAVTVDGAACPTPCTVTRAVGATVAVSAPASLPNGPNSRMDFDGWPGSGSASANWTFTLNAVPVTLNATYHTMNLLTITSNPANGASWTMQPASSDGYYNAQASVTVTGSPQFGFRFSYWTGDLSGSTPAGTLAMNMPHAAQAVMTRVPYIGPAGVVNGAAVTPEAGVAPGSIISIFGASLADNQVTGPASPMLQALDCATVTVGARLLPLFFVSPTQINAQLPDDIQLGPQTVAVNCQGLPAVQAQFTTLRNVPGVFQQVVGGQNFAVALHADGSQVTTAAPAQSGETLSLYCTGLGPSVPSRPEGFAVPASPAYLISDPVTVQAGGVSIPAGSAFAAPGLVGIDIVQFSLAAGVPSSTNIQLLVTVNGQSSNTVLLPVQ